MRRSIIDRIPAPIRPALGLLLLTAVYFAAGRLGLSITFVHAQASPVWPPTGIAIAAVWIWGRRVWPALLVGAFLFNLTTSGHVASSLLIGVGNMAEGLVGGLLARRFGGDNPFEKPSRAAAFMGAGLVAPLVSATVGAGALLAFDSIAWSGAASVWGTWYLGDVGGAFVMAPLLVLLAQAFKDGWNQDIRETVAALAATAAVAGLVFFTSFTPGDGLSFLLLLILFWPVLRLDSLVTSAAVFIIAAIAVIGTSGNMGPFDSASGNQALLNLQVFLIVISAVLLPSSAWLRPLGLARQNEELAQRLTSLTHQLQQAQGISNIGSWEWDVAEDKITWSDELYRLYGLRPQEFEATFDSYMERVHPDDKERVQALIQASFQTHEDFTFDHRAVKPDGSVLWMHSQGKVETDDDGNVVRMFGTGQDITARKVAEKQFESLLESAPDGMFMVDETGRIVLVNAQAGKMFGYERDELLGNRIEMLVPKDRRGVHEGHRSGYMKDPKTRPMGMGLELSALRKDGSEFPVEISLSPIEGSEGRNVVAVVRDVTEKKRLADADRLAFSQGVEIEKLREMDQFKTQVLNTAAHELNTPITPLRLQLHLLKTGMEDLDERKQRAIQILDRNVQRLQDLVADFLDVARLQSGRLRIEPQPVDLAEVVDDAVQTFVEHAKDSGIAIRVEADDHFETWADPNRISQIMYNFLSNAIKFSSEGATITVRAVRMDDRERVEVSDQGMGLTAEQKGQLFQPFTQLHRHVPGAPSGTGLGLFICKGVIEEHGGRIGAESEGEGKGSTFWFELPVRTEEDWKAMAAETEGADDSEE